MNDHGKYLYCIIPCSQKRVFDDVVSIGSLSGPVHAIHHCGLAAVVSDSLVTKYDITRANLLAHQRVLERVMRDYPILPVRFGTVANSAEPDQSICKLLEKRSQEFQELLSFVQSRVELGVKSLWRDEKAIFQEILAENPALQKLRDRLVGKPPEATHFDRMRLGKMVKETLDRKRRSEAETFLAPLKQIAERLVEGSMLVDRVVVNSAFLVSKEREEEFGRAVEGLDQKVGDRVTVKFFGPVPPYNFVNIMVNWEEL